jgi:hypothetical protein
MLRMPWCAETMLLGEAMKLLDDAGYPASDEWRQRYRRLRQLYEHLQRLPEEPTEPRCHFMAFRQAQFQCTKSEGHEGLHSCGLAPETMPTENGNGL